MSTVCHKLSHVLYEFDVNKGCFCYWVCSSYYHQDVYLTTGSRTSDYTFVTNNNDDKLPAHQTLNKTRTEFENPFIVLGASEEVANVVSSLVCSNI